MIHSKELPDFITAGSPRGLRLKMFRLNTKFGSYHKFFDIGTFKDRNGKQKWIAWYFKELKNLGDVEDVVSGGDE